jgi:hypothetical protein
MTWNNYADYDLPMGILSRISEVAWHWNDGGYGNLPTDRPIKLFFTFREPMPPFADELMADLMAHDATVHQSDFRSESLPVMPTSNFTEADAVITFYASDSKAYGDAEHRLDYEVKCTVLGGSFHVR